MQLSSSVPDQVHGPAKDLLQDGTVESDDGGVAKGFAHFLLTHLGDANLSALDPTRTDL